MRNALAVLFASGIVVSAGSALAQSPPTAAPVVPVQHCTGVLCDAYYAVHPNGDTQLPCRDFVCGMFGGRTAEAPPPQQTVMSEPAPAPVPHKVHRKHVKAAKVSKAAPAESAAQ